MKMNFIVKGFNPQSDLEGLANKKYAKLDRYFKSEVDVELILKFVHMEYVAEATIEYSGYVFRVAEKSADPYKAMNNALDKMERQIIRQKDKFVDKNRGIIEVDEDVTDIVPGDSVEHKIVKFKKFTMKPMTLDEAVLQMEMLDHSFYVFVNGDTFNVNVVYKRGDGDYGLIEPDVE